MYRYYPQVLDVHVMLLCFYKRSTLEPVFANQKRSEEDFCFFWKMVEGENSIESGFAVSPHRGSAHPGLQSGPTKLLSWNYTRVPTPKLPWLWPVCASICVLSRFIVYITSNMCPKVTEKPKRG